MCPLCGSPCMCPLSGSRCMCTLCDSCCMYPLWGSCCMCPLCGSRCMCPLCDSCYMCPLWSSCCMCPLCGSCCMCPPCGSVSLMLQCSSHTIVIMRTSISVLTPHARERVHILTHVRCPWVCSHSDSDARERVLTLTVMLVTVFSQWPWCSWACSHSDGDARDCVLTVTVMLVSVFSLTIISLDRMVGVALPFHRHLSHRASLLLIVAIWIIAPALAVPFAIYRIYSVGDRPEGCTGEWVYLRVGVLVLGCTCYGLTCFLVYSFWSVVDWECSRSECSLGGFLVWRCSRLRRNACQCNDINSFLWNKSCPFLCYIQNLHSSNVK